MKFSKRCSHSKSKKPRLGPREKPRLGPREKPRLGPREKLGYTYTCIPFTLILEGDSSMNSGGPSFDGSLPWP